MTILLGGVQLAILLIICLYELEKKSVSVFLWAVLILMFGIMHFFTTINGDYEYSEKVINKASIFVIVFCVSYLFCRKVINKFLTEQTIKINTKYEYKKADNRFLNFLVIMLIIIVIIQLLNLTISAGGIKNTSWGNMRKATANSEYLSYSQVFTTIFFTTSSCIILSLIRGDKRKFIIVVLVNIVEVVISRNRIEILPIFCSIIIYYILKMKKITLKQITFFVILAIFAIYSVYALRVYRHYGTLQTFVKEFNFVEFNEKVNLYLKTDNGELGLRRHFYYFINSNNDFNDFGKGHTYIRMLMVGIPTQWSFGIKPSDFAISMGSAIDPTIVGYSIHPTLFGDVYANFGDFGVLMGFFWALYTSIIDRILQKQKQSIKITSILICSVAYVIIGRGSVYNGFVWQFYGLIIIQVLSIISRFRFIRKNER